MKDSYSICMMSNGDTKMNEEIFWKEVLNDVEVGTTAVVITIIQREGSAPNVPGAKMLVTPETIIGTVGGGNSEHKLVELAKKIIDHVRQNFARPRVDVEKELEQSGGLEEKVEKIDESQVIV